MFGIPKRMTCRYFYGVYSSKYGFPSNNRMSQPGQVVGGTPLGSVISIPVFPNTPENITNLLTKHIFYKHDANTKYVRSTNSVKIKIRRNNQ